MNFTDEQSNIGKLNLSRQKAQKLEEFLFCFKDKSTINKTI